MVLTASRFRPVVDEAGGALVTVTASTASATASSGREASKKTFSPTEMTRRVIGGREGVCTAGLVLMLVLVSEEG